MINKYYQKNTERLRKKVRESYQKINEEEKEKRLSIIKNVKRSWLALKKIII